MSKKTVNHSRKRCFNLILYPDSIDYDCSSLLKSISSSGDSFAYILHDRDSYLHDVFDSDSGELLYSSGSHKKNHVHVVLYYKDARTISSISKQYDIPENMIEIVKSVKGIYRYLVHKDDPEKFQYDISDVVTNISLDKYLKDNKDEVKQLLDLVNFLESEDVVNPFQLLHYVCDNPDLYPAFRRNGAMLNNCMQYTKNSYSVNKRRSDYIDSSYLNNNNNSGSGDFQRVYCSDDDFSSLDSSDFYSD